MNMNKTKLGLAILALSLTQAVSATEAPAEIQQDKQNTYWGIGIGSVLGAVIAGPPGAAIGGTLGGSIGWGKDQSDANEDLKEEVAEKELALIQHQQHLENNLKKSEREVYSLKSKQAELLSRMQALQAKQDDRAQELAFLEKLVGHYTQDIYFRIGQSAAPEDTRARLSNLVELLKAYPDLQVTLKGYTDPSGSAKLNAALAEARVASIQQLLLAEGIEESRISGQAIGEVPELIPPTQNPVALDSFPEELDLALESQSVPESTPVIKRNPMLDRRVAIELSLPEMLKQQTKAPDQTLASLSGGEKIVGDMSGVEMSGGEK